MESSVNWALLLGIITVGVAIFGFMRAQSNANREELKNEVKTAVDGLKESLKGEITAAETNLKQQIKAIGNASRSASPPTRINWRPLKDAWAGA